MGIVNGKDGVLSLGAVGEETKVADTHEAVGQDMKQEAGVGALTRHRAEPPLLGRCLEVPLLG